MWTSRKEGKHMSLTVSYSVNGKPITKEDLSKLQITKKDYTDYMDSIKRDFNYQSKSK